jgi:hypothetical protein
VRAAIAFSAALLALGPAPAARAGDPTMPMAQVKPGMKCTAYTVIRGTDITSFDAEVVDIVEDKPYQPSILFKVSGPAVDDGGIAAGMSGSPVYCKDDQGTPRNAGAIAAVAGDYGNKLAYATGIEEILSESPDPPFGQPKTAARRRGRPLAAPLTVAGLSAPVQRALVAAAARGSRPVIVAPRLSAAQAPPAAPFKPGSAVSLGLSSGDLWVGAIGTVAYVDGDVAWLFGHPFEAAGRRSLLLQDAYVYTVVPNPNPELGGSYKLAAPIHDVGSITNDALAAVVGRAGSLPPTTDVVVNTRDLDTAREERTNVTVADETGVDVPTGLSPLSFVAPLTVADATVRVARSVPARQSGEGCMRIELRSVADPIRFCNRYVVQQGGGIGGPVADDLTKAILLLDDVDFASLAVERVESNVDVRRGARLAYMLGASLPRRARAGSRITVSLRTRVVRGPLKRFTFQVRVPRGLSAGSHQLRISGTDPEAGSELGSIFGEDVIFGDESADEPKPIRSLAELRRNIEAIGFYDGIRARFAGEDEVLRVFRDPVYRIGGDLKLRLRVAR